MKIIKQLSYIFLLLSVIGCVKTNQGYNCESGNCKPALAGSQYITLADCKSDCGESAPQTPGTGTGGGTTPVTPPPPSTPPAKGQVMIWTNQVEYGWIPKNWKGSGTGGHNVMTVTVAGFQGSIFGGRYTSEPACGATYAYTKSLEPGTYTVSGKVYFIKDIYGNSYTAYSTSQTFKVYSNQCTKVMLR